MGGQPEGAALRKDMAQSSHEDLELRNKWDTFSRQQPSGCMSNNHHHAIPLRIQIARRASTYPDFGRRRAWAHGPLTDSSRKAAQHGRLSVYKCAT